MCEWDLSFPVFNCLTLLFFPGHFPHYLNDLSIPGQCILHENWLILGSATPPSFFSAWSVPVVYFSQVHWEWQEREVLFGHDRLMCVFRTAVNWFCVSNLWKLHSICAELTLIPNTAGWGNKGDDSIYTRKGCAKHCMIVLSCLWGAVCSYRTDIASVDLTFELTRSGSGPCRALDKYMFNSAYTHIQIQWLCIISPAGIPRQWSVDALLQ